MLFEVAKILPKHQITLPKEVRAALELEVGDQVVFIETHDGILMRRVDTKIINTIINQDSNEGGN
jgi:AbrB family looped-hinge helix DNA binding protein